MATTSTGEEAAKGVSAARAGISKLATRGTAAVLGGGSWGTALAHLLGTHGYDTLLWMRDEEIAEEVNTKHSNSRYLEGYPVDPRVRATTDLNAAASHAKVIIVAVPSKALREVACRIGEHVTGDQILLSATKGLEADTLTRMSDVLLEETCARKVGALSGPNLAAEVMAGQPSATVVASRFEEVVETAERMLAGPAFRLYGNYDIVGVEIAGALKNIIAIAAGISAGMGFGANTQALLMTRGLAEISRFGMALGAEQLTFQGLAGVGDLFCTASSPLSRNHTVGRRLAGGEKLDDIIDDMLMVAEGVNTTRAVTQHCARLGVDMPIAAGMYSLLFEDAELQDVLAALMTRTSVYEGAYTPIGAKVARTTSVLEYAARLKAMEANKRYLNARDTQE